MISMYYTSISKEYYSKYFHVLLEEFPIEFKNRILRYSRWQDAWASLLGRLLLKRGLRKSFNYNLNFEAILYNEYSKPYFINDLNLDFNISHSGDFVCCAISNDSRIGIDIEKIRSNINITDFYNQMTKIETGKIKQSENYPKAFYKYWTQKEAVIKLEGKGLSIPLKSFEVINGVTYVLRKKIYLKEILVNNLYTCNIASYDNFMHEKIKISNTELCAVY